MYEDLEKLIALVEDLGLFLEDPSNDRNYETRLFLQKIAFIAQSLGMDFSYRFRLYLNGPYCPSLTQDYYSHPNLVVSLRSNYILSGKDKIISKAIKENILSNPLNENHKSEFLEALATVLFIKREHPDLLDDEIFRRIKELKGYLSDRLIIIALNTAKKLSFKDEYLSKEIQEELDLWDKAED
jgi:uncharacterized protein YwgA